MSELTGTITGSSRKAIINHVRDIATRYFDTPCVRVSLSDERAETEHLDTLTQKSNAITGVRFEADYTAYVQHKSNQAAYGIPKCMICDVKLR